MEGALLQARGVRGGGGAAVSDAAVASALSAMLHAVIQLEVRGGGERAVGLLELRGAVGAAFAMVAAACTNRLAATAVESNRAPAAGRGADVVAVAATVAAADERANLHGMALFWSVYFEADGSQVGGGTWWRRYSKWSMANPARQRFDSPAALVHAAPTVV
jgi:hypothetical protein